MHALRLALASLLPLIALAACPPLAAAQDNADAQADATTTPFTGPWAGAVALPGAELAVMVRFTDTDPPAATLTIPLQQITDAPLADVSLGPEQARFTLTQPHTSVDAVFSVRFNPDTRGASGALAQGGAMFPVALEPITEAEAAGFGLNRPQTPEPPFPYTTRDAAFDNPDAGVSLTGTLTIPEGPGPHPAAIFLTGSGPQDRDETIAGHKPFLVLADHLARHGIASLRYDDRGMGGSTGSTMDATKDDFVADARAALRWLADQPEIDAHRIALLGHSEGATIAAFAAADDPRVAAVVALAGPGLDGADILVTQLADILAASGVDQSRIEQQTKAQRRMLDLILQGAPEDEIDAAALRLLALQSGADPAAPAALEQLRASALPRLRAQIDSAWFRDLLRVDPADAYARLDVPTLVLFAGNDLQVHPEDNLPPVRRALDKAPTDDVTIRTLPGLNHLFQPSETGLLNEYATIETTLDPALLDAVAQWLRDTLDAGAR